jgi:AcrR family transcriptional regulator
MRKPLPAHPLDHADVPRRLIEAAGDVFAEKGYEGTTVRDIVARAGTNLNSVNYHFGSKEELYVAVMRHQVTLAERSHPQLSRHFRTADPGQALRQAVEDLVRWLLNPDSLLPRLYALELVNPSSAFTAINFSSPLQEALRSGISALLGPQARPEDVANCLRSVYSQCAHYMFIRRVLPRMDPGFRFSEQKVQEISGHITRFSLGGIAAVRAERTPRRRRRKS